jgi:hypothetical protein
LNDEQTPWDGYDGRIAITESEESGICTELCGGIDESAAIEFSGVDKGAFKTEDGGGSFGMDSGSEVAVGASVSISRLSRSVSRTSGGGTRLGFDSRAEEGLNGAAGGGEGTAGTFSTASKGTELGLCGRRSTSWTAVSGACEETSESIVRSVLDVSLFKVGSGLLEMEMGASEDDASSSSNA